MKNVYNFVYHFFEKGLLRQILTMANAKIILHKSRKLKGNRYPVVLRITHDRIRKYYIIGEKNNREYSCTIEEWDKENRLFRKGFEGYSLKNAVLQNKLSIASNIIINFEREGKEFSFEEFSTEFYDKTTKITVESFFNEISEDLLKSERVGYANVFTYTKNAINNYSNSELTFKEINYSFLSGFETHLRSQGVKPNSIFVYMRTLRTAFNMAIKRGYVKESQYPFRSRLNSKGYSIEHLKKDTSKRAISLKQMMNIINYATEIGNSQFHAKNYFVFCFFCRGMNFHDLAHLKWTNIINGRIEYLRQKTGTYFTIAILPEIQRILDYYSMHRKSSYIFPILNDEMTSAEIKYMRIKNVLKCTNYHLNQIASGCDIDFNITTYVSRHSWATLNKQLGVPASIIKEGLGHKTEAQTETYLKSFENNVVDDVNIQLAKILSKR